MHNYSIKSDYSSLRSSKAYNYAKDIVEGKILANIYIVKVCKKFLEMIDNEASRYYQLYFVDEKMVDKIEGIVKLTNFATGEYAGKSCYDHIQGFQWFILVNLYCVFRRDNIKKRRYEKATVFISRKNAKTWLISMFMLLGLLFEPDYAQLVAAANTREQAKILFNEIKKTLEVSPHLLKYFKITSNNITCKLNSNVLFPIASEARNTDGMMVSVGCVDEFGSARDDSIYQSLQTSMLSITNRLLFCISTAYPYSINPMKDQIEYGKKVLDDLIEDDKYFMMHYALDDNDDWTDETLWIKSNPLQAVSENGLDFLRSECKMALEMESKQIAFRTKNLNQWLEGSAGKSFVTVEDFQKCKLDSEYDWSGREVVIGCDLSQSTDLTSVSMSTYDEALDKYIVKNWSFLPADTVDERIRVEKVNYHILKEQGHCFFCGDRVINYLEVEDFILNLESKYGVKIKYFAYDRYNAIATANRMEQAGYEVIEVKQHSTVLHAPIKLLKESILTNKFAYENNRLLEIAISNAKETHDTNLNLYISKKLSTGRIDPVFSMLNCFAIHYDEKINNTSIYESDERSEGFIII